MPFQKTLARLHKSTLIARKYLMQTFLKFKATEHTFMVIAALVIGLLAGLGAVGIHYALKLFRTLFWGTAELDIAHYYAISWWVKILIPTGAALVVGFIIQYVAREAKGHGVPEVMEAVALRGGIIRPRVVVAKLLASSIFISGGGSVGREGPIIQIGSSIGSMVGQFLQVNTQRMRTFVGCGAAAGIAAAFNAPIAGALFSLEIILGDFGVPQFSPIVIAAVTATVVSHIFLGDERAFTVPSYELISPFEFIPYVILGFISGFVALMFIKTLYRSEVLFDNMKAPEYVKTTIGGLIIGAMGCLIPHIYGVGYDTMMNALNGSLEWQWLLLLIFMKIFATSISLGSGGSGGIFAPSLFLGAMTGGFFGEFIHQFLPNITASSGAYALVGMGAVVAAATNAPISAILIIFEMTNDYSIILPLMVTSIIATIFRSKMLKESIYTIKLVNRGVQLFKGRDTNVLRSIQVKEIMDKNVELIPQNLPFKALMKKVMESPHQHFFVVDKEKNLIGAISFRQIRQVLQDQENLANVVVAHDLVENSIPTISENETLDNAMKIFGMHHVDIMPVHADGESQKKIIGQIALKDVIEKYNTEISKYDVTSELAHSVQFLDEAKTLDFVEGYSLAEITCPHHFAGKSLKDLNLRAEYDIHVILIKRKGPRNKIISIVPTPGEKLQKDDIIIVVGPDKSVERVKNL